MARLALVPTAVSGLTAISLTDLIAAGTLGANTGVSYANSGREFLAVAVAAGGSTCTVNIGTTIEGQAVTSLTITLTASKTMVIPPFHSDVNQTGANAGQAWVDFGTAANVTVALLQVLGTS